MIVEFYEWITQKYIQWRGARVGNHASIAEFAKSLGTSQQVMSDWMKPGGSMPRSKKYIDALIDKYGEEVYTVLGLPAPADPLAGLPEDFRMVVLSVQHELDALDVRPDSPEGIKLIDEILARYGFTRIDK